MGKTKVRRELEGEKVYGTYQCPVWYSYIKDRKGLAKRANKGKVKKLNTK